VRLDRLLANLGYGSRREVQALIAAGEVGLDDNPLTSAAAHVQPDPQLARRLTVAGQPIDPPPPLTVIVNKPPGFVCSHREAGRSIYELLPPRWRRRTPALSTVGRLDAQTSGLLLITDDGDFLHRIISPRRHVAKRYWAKLARPLESHIAARFAAGDLMLDGETRPLAPATLEPIAEDTAWLTISEGRYHQVRRMFAAVGNHVEELRRDAIGGLELPDDLTLGGWRIARDDELASIFA
jgi:16S rRNA pseudouridine516 synthase